jgi:hypothetical protein
MSGSTLLLLVIAVGVTLTWLSAEIANGASWGIGVAVALIILWFISHRTKHQS